MLNSLRFQNIALFGNLEIDFDKGFTVFTGQTGSGKSIFIDTLNALLASKKTSIDDRLVAKDSSFSSIEGVFSVSPLIKDWLSNQEFEEEDDLIVTREWRLKEKKYKSRFRINGVLANRDQISKLRSLLLDFTLQGDTFILNDCSNQLKLLDSLGLKKIQESIDNVKKIIDRLSEFQSSKKLFLVSFLDVQKKIMNKAPNKYWVILFRRAMVRLSCIIAKKINAKALVTGENVGQVASQTLSNINVVSEPADIPILRPLIGYNKKEIINLATKIKTYEISILPYEDCCGFFVPKHPETKAKMFDIDRINSNLDLKLEYIEAMDKIEKIKIQFKGEE